MKLGTSIKDTYDGQRGKVIRITQTYVVARKRDGSEFTVQTGSYRKGNVNVRQIELRADDEIQERYGCRTFRTTKRCPQCRTQNVKRRADGVCFVCAVKEDMKART